MLVGRAAIVVERDSLHFVSPGILCEFDASNALKAFAQYALDPADPGSTIRWRHATRKTNHARNN